MPCRTADPFITLSCVQSCVEAPLLGLAALVYIQAVRPGMQVLRVSAKTGLGMNEFINFLCLHRAGP